MHDALIVLVDERTHVNLIAAVLFGVVHGFVGSSDQSLVRIGFVSMGQRNRCAHAHGDRNTQFAKVNGIRFDTMPDTLGDLFQPFFRRLNGQDDKFFSTEASQDIGLSQHRLERQGDTLQHNVAELVSVRVVQILEAIDVGENNSNGGAGSAATIHFLFECFIEEVPVIDIRQRVVEGLPFELEVSRFQFLLLSLDDMLFRHGLRAGDMFAHSQFDQVLAGICAQVVRAAKIVRFQTEQLFGVFEPRLNAAQDLIKVGTAEAVQSGRQFLQSSEGGVVLIRAIVVADGSCDCDSPDQIEIIVAAELLKLFRCRVM